MSPDADGRSEWSDARLDAFWAEFQRQSVIVDRVPVIEEMLKTTAKDAAICRTNIHAVRNDMAVGFSALRSDTAATAIAQAAERKSDRKWLVGAILSAAGLVIAAVGILAGHIG